MSIWTDFAQMFSQEAKKYKHLFFSPQRVDVDYDAAPFKEGEAYCRLWLVEMRLSKGIEWFKRRYPVVHSAIRFNHGGKVVTIPHLAGPGFLKELAQDNLDKIIQCNHPLTPLFPFNRGEVEVQAGLFSMVANDQIDKFITTMGRFSKLLPVPELSTVLNLADPVYGGIQDLLGTGDGRLELGYQQTFVGSNGGGDNDLRPGYFVAMLAEDKRVDDKTLCVVSDSLRIGVPGKVKEFVTDYHFTPEGYSYMLFRLEKRTAQDWESLTNIKALVYKAQEAVVSRDFEQAEQMLTAVKIAIFRSPDLTKSDKRQMVLRITDELREWGLQSTKGEIPKPSLYAIMQRPTPTVDAKTETELDALEKLFEG